MIKIILLLLAFVLSVVTSSSMCPMPMGVFVLCIIGMAFAYLGIFALVFFLIPLVLGLRVKKGVPPKRYSKAYRNVFLCYEWFWAALFGVKLTTTGLEKIPRNGTFVLVQNHRSNMDSIVTDFAFRKYPLVFVAKEALFNVPFFGRIITQIGYIRMVRNVSYENISEMCRAIRYLSDDGVCIGIYPEGHRNREYPNPQLLDFEEGAFLIAKRAKRPIVVTVIDGTEKINERLLVSTHKVRLDVLSVIYPDEYAGKSTDELCHMVRDIMLKAVSHN